ncbi:MAG: NADH-quinone oxidoreductase subunit J, partial [Bacteroidales bacterium]|nr:NADH-quinone oxidoreductase subunit J [Bacteroidales bacterium]
MKIMAEQIIFYVLAIVIVVFSILSVSSKRILRSATYLLFVLLATAGLYLLMGYQFLFGVQISVYAGGIMVLYIFSILLTSHAGD